jgi:DnaJ-class molecular chaperone
MKPSKRVCRKYKKCSQCGGSGIIKTVAWDKKHYFEVRVNMICMLCGGDGKEGKI